MDYRAKDRLRVRLGLVVRSPIVRCIVKCDPICVYVQTDVDRSDARLNHSKSTTDVTKCKQLEWKSGLATRSSQGRRDDQVPRRTA